MEVKHDLEVALKNCKTNEKLLHSEMDHLREKTEAVCSKELPEKEKELKSLKSQMAEVQIQISPIKGVEILNLQNYTSYLKRETRLEHDFKKKSTN